MSLKALYLRGEAVKEVRGGADVVSSTMHRMLAEYLGPGRLEDFFVGEHAPAQGRLAVLGAALKGQFDGFGGRTRRLFAERVRGKRLVFVDQSVYGFACADAKRTDPACVTAVLFHNDEYRYYRDLALRAGRPQNLLLAPVVRRCERAALEAADLVICLSERDSRLLSADYGRGADLIMPAVVEDRRGGPSTPQPREASAPFTMLFVGSAFPPNVEGVRWFVREVLPSVEGRLLVVGRGFESERETIAGPRCEVPGGVDDLRPYYEMADCVISPIFWGSGIKVKTAEAFMFGKAIVGTDEAFEGYDARRAGAKYANTAGEFVAALRGLRDERARGESARRARSYYEASLSYGAQFGILSAALDGLLGKAGLDD